MLTSIFRAGLLLGLLLSGKLVLGQRLAAGDYHTATIRADGTLWAWGANGSGQAGSPVLTSSPTVPRQVGTATTWRDLAAGLSHTLAIRQDGTLWAWGLNGSGQLGQGTTTNQPTPTQVGSAATWKSVAGGAYHSLAIRQDGTLWAWGAGSSGQLGTGVFTTQLLPVQVGTATWRSAAVGVECTAAIRADGTLWTWGANGYDGQLGLGGSGYQQHTPAQVGTATWLSVAVGRNHMLAVRADGTLWAWGNNTRGQLGLGAAAGPVHRFVPQQVGTATTWASVAAGGDHSAALRQDGTLWAWGSNNNGELGLGTLLDAGEPAQVGIGAWQAVACGYSHTAALRPDNSLYTWGYASASSLGNGLGLLAAPVLLLPASTWRSVAVGDSHTAAVQTNGTLWTLGSNQAGQLGLGSFTSQSAPTQVGTVSTWQSVVCGNAHTLALRQDGTLWAWGSNDQGQLGLGTLLAATVPTQVGTATWRSVSAGYKYTMGIRPDGTLWAWGTGGALGFAAPAAQTMPVQIGTDTWRSVSAGYNHTLAIRQDGTLWAWGPNGSGQLGNGNASFGVQIEPLQISAATNWASVSAGWGYSLAVRTDGTRWVWGDNSYNRLGTSAVSLRVPTQVGAAAWASTVASYYSTAAIGQDGSLWTWGDNSLGQLGQGLSNTTQVGPTQVGSAGWQAVAVSRTYHMAGIQANGTLWVWGYNTNGQLGQPYAYPLPQLIAVGSPLAAAGPALPAAWSLAPNPTRGRTQLLGLPAGPVEGQLFDARGQLVRTTRAAEVDLAGLPTGLYLLRATAASTTRTLRLVVE